MRRAFKRIVASSPGLLRLLNRISGNQPKVFVYHRFSPSGVSIPHRVDAETLAWQLDVMRRDFEIISFEECIDRYLKTDIWPRGCVILTIDDGYRDMYEHAWHELRKRNLPATFFVTTGFVNDNLWLWPDRLEYVLRNAQPSKYSIEMGGKEIAINLETHGSIAGIWKVFSDYCISVNDKLRISFIDTIEKTLAVTRPSVPPPEYSPVSWSQLREMQADGIEIGGHTVTHPILSKLDIDSLDGEVSVCRQILQEGLSAPIQTFCYPNSGPGDINEDVLSAVFRAGYKGAVFGTDLNDWDRFRVPRMGLSNDRTDFLWKLYGGEVLAAKMKKSNMSAS
jgi:peptidoglycan/xylan/chitin deacetylase (PgdA/CDA1 family)